MKTMVNDKASSLCILLCDQKVTEGMVYTIKYEPKMMLMGCTIIIIHVIGFTGTSSHNASYATPNVS